MADRLEDLFQMWYRLSGSVLLAQVDDTTLQPESELTLAESTAYCRASGRLTWIVLDWMIQHIDEIDENKLVQQTRQYGDLSVLGGLCDAADQYRPYPRFKQLMQQCAPNDELVPFFHRVARSPLATRLSLENNLELFRRWNYICSELHYLSADVKYSNVQIAAQP